MSAPPRGLKAVIFDFDGLILDTEWPEYQSWCEVYESHGHFLPLEKWCLTVGAGKGHGFDPYGHLERLTGRPVDREEIRGRRRARNAELILERPLLDGVLERLNQAESLGLRLGVASSSDSGWVVGHMKRLDLAHRFEAIVCAEGDLPAKPDPAVYRAVLDSLEVGPREAIALEDSPNGITAARDAGLYCLAVPNRVTAALDFSQADGIIESLLDLDLSLYR